MPETLPSPDPPNLPDVAVEDSDNHPIASSLYVPACVGVLLYPAEGDSRMIILSLWGKVIRERPWKFSGEAMETSRLRLSPGRFRRSGGGGAFRGVSLEIALTK